MAKHNGKFGKEQMYTGNLNIKCTGPKQPADNLSGGNQQKVIMAKWLLRDAEIYSIISTSFTLLKW